MLHYTNQIYQIPRWQEPQKKKAEYMYHENNNLAKVKTNLILSWLRKNHWKILTDPNLKAVDHVWESRPVPNVVRNAGITATITRSCKKHNIQPCNVDPPYFAPNLAQPLKTYSTRTIWSHTMPTHMSTGYDRYQDIYQFKSQLAGPSQYFPA